MGRAGHTRRARLSPQVLFGNRIRCPSTFVTALTKTREGWIRDKSSLREDYGRNNAAQDPDETAVTLVTTTAKAPEQAITAVITIASMTMTQSGGNPPVVGTVAGGGKNMTLAVVLLLVRSHEASKSPDIVTIVAVDAGYYCGRSLSSANVVVAARHYSHP
ncbi:hypothetical protein CPLU01_11669 [Colletotrichum plurivorum]|uniref:Uncharacterized protein n=1 Tax=Colletotrichum plurivorum TaxID=2175906 RepID=A0A8H6K1H8_9PEZI|nr:hypothetical protein CPLU01_11669 [Colletotrichum plurivorum]